MNVVEFWMLCFLNVVVMMSLSVWQCTCKKKKKPEAAPVPEEAVPQEVEVKADGPKLKPGSDVYPHS